MRADRWPTFRPALVRDTFGWPAIRRTGIGFPDGGTSSVYVTGVHLYVSTGVGDVEGISIGILTATTSAGKSLLASLPYGGLSKTGGAVLLCLGRGNLKV